MLRQPSNWPSASAAPATRSGGIARSRAAPASPPRSTASSRIADAVVVIWTKASIESPWVQDEAAEGRDSGRLVPVILGTDKPPLGFRQFQSIDFGDWNGEGDPQALDALIRAIAQKGPEPQTAPVAEKACRQGP